MKNKYHKIFLEAAKKLSRKDESLYQKALNISESLTPSSILELCKSIHTLQKEADEEVLNLCRDLYFALCIVVGVNRVQEISTHEYNTQKNDTAAVEKTLDELIAELNQLVGLSKVKEKVADLIAYKKIQELRKEHNLKIEASTLHLAFLGNPGTGKTTVARIVGLIYKQLGVLSKGHFIEVSRTDLIAGYQGQTALKVKRVIEKAKGGILFIDEAYSITENEHSDSYGRECLTELTKALEDYRDDLVVIVAGYTKPMNKFFESNPGLKSRFNTFIEFDDYRIDELLLIFSQLCKKNDYIISLEAKEKISEILDKKSSDEKENFSNGRFVRNLYENIVLNHARRVSKLHSPSKEELQEIKIEDIV